MNDQIAVGPAPKLHEMPKPIFVPLLDNGNGQVMAAFVMDYAAAFGTREVFMIRASDSHANRGMNKIANAFLDSPCDIWINIDADIRFTRQDIDRILSHDLPLVYGLYPKKEEACTPCVGTFDEIPKPDERGLVIVRRAGRGFMLVHRRVLEMMKEENGGPALRYHNHEKVEWDFFPSGVVIAEFSCYGNEFLKDGTPKREWISEDWMFCEHARKLGFPTYVDTGIALGHVGQKEYRFRGEQITHVDTLHVKSWRDIDGWFDFEDVYRMIVRHVPDNGRFLEVGCWLGKSIAAFADFAARDGKNIDMHVVDTFQGKPANAHQEAILNVHGGNVEKMFRANIEALGLTDKITVHVEDSAKLGTLMEAQRFDAIFIDGDHSEEAVYKDICVWAGNVNRGGILAGHDIDEAGVKQAVLRFFGDDFETVGRCWLVKDW